MINGSIVTRMPNTLPRLAATAVVCWVLGTNTYFDSANTSRVVLWNSQPEPYQASTQNDALPNLQVLGAKDANIYQDIFHAQAAGDWPKADAGIAKLKDKSLLGHVLADRYQRRPATVEELKDWLGKYADLPESPELYETAVALAGKDTRLPEPATADLWSGSDSYGSALGFRAVADHKASAAAHRFAGKLNGALHHNNPLSAEKLLETEKHHRLMPPHEIASAEGLIAASYFRNGQITYARHMADAGAKQQNALALWIDGLAAWKQNEPAAAGKAFALLAAQPDLSVWDRAAAQFWAARSLKRSGDIKNSNFWLEQAAHHPHSFYGLMAAHLMGNNASWSWELPELNVRQIAMIGKQKAGSRALALLQINQRELAETELRHLNPQGQRDLQDAMLALANAEHMPSLALQLGGVATRANGSPYDAALYPLPPWQPVEGFKVDRALLYALMRHESQFDPMAVSDRGACGLMQLLPATAKLMTDKVSDKTDERDCSAHLLDPTVNIALGQKYVRHLTDQPLVGDNLMLLLAAYNEGPGKLARSLKKNHTVASNREFEKEDPLFFLESLQTRETHDYIEQVLIHYWSYRARLSEPETSLTELAHGQWPRYAPPPVNAHPPKGLREAAAGMQMVSSE